MNNENENEKPMSDDDVIAEGIKFANMAATHTMHGSLPTKTVMAMVCAIKLMEKDYQAMDAIRDQGIELAYCPEKDGSNVWPGKFEASGPDGVSTVAYHDDPARAVLNLVAVLESAGEDTA